MAFQKTEDITIYLGPGSYTSFRSGALTYNNVVADRFYAASPSSGFYRMIPSLFYMQTTCTLPECLLQYEYDGTNFPATYLNDGAQLYYNNTEVYAPGYSRSIINARRAGTQYEIVFDSNDSMNMTNGAFMGNILVVGSNNIITGIGEVRGTITLNGQNSSLIFAMAGSILSTISLNSGMLILMNDITMIQPNCFTSDRYNKSPELPNDLRSSSPWSLSTFTYDTPLTWVGNNGHIAFESDMVLSSTWTIAGQVTINGNGNTLTFAQGALVVAPNSQLTIENCRLNDILPNQITCIDSTGTIILDNAAWVQSDNYEFEQGTLNFKWFCIDERQRVQLYLHVNTDKYNSGQFKTFR